MISHQVKVRCTSHESAVRKDAGVIRYPVFMTHADTRLQAVRHGPMRGLADLRDGTGRIRDVRAGWNILHKMSCVRGVTDRFRPDFRQGHARTAVLARAARLPFNVRTMANKDKGAERIRRCDTGRQARHHGRGESGVATNSRIVTPYRPARPDPAIRRARASVRGGTEMHPRARKKARCPCSEPWPL